MFLFFLFSRIPEQLDSVSPFFCFVLTLAKRSAEKHRAWEGAEKYLQKLRRKYFLYETIF